MSRTGSNIGASVEALERVYYQCLVSIPELGGSWRSRLSDTERRGVCALLDTYGEPFMVEALRVVFAKWKYFHERYWGMIELEDEATPIEWICDHAEEVFLEIMLYGGLDAKPRSAGVQKGNLRPIQLAWRKFLPTVWGRAVNLPFVWGAPQNSGEALLLQQANEVTATELIEIVCAHWGRFRRLRTPIPVVPSLRVIALQADEWIDFVTELTVPPSIAPLSELPTVPRGACGPVEGEWRAALAAACPSVDMGVVNQLWTAHQKRILDDLIADWGEALIGVAIRHFFGLWKRIAGMLPASASPSHAAFEVFCTLWCPGAAWRMRSATGARQMRSCDLREQDARMVEELTSWFETQHGDLVDVG